MTSIIREEILKDFGELGDILSWIGPLQKLAAWDGSSLIWDELHAIGPTSIAQIGMAVVEKAIERNLIARGDKENKRDMVLKLYAMSFHEAGYWAGEADTMLKLSEMEPRLVPALNQFHEERSARRFLAKRRVAMAVLELLEHFEKRHRRRGQKGRPRMPSELDMSPHQRRLWFIDGEILNECSRRLPIAEQRDIEAIRSNIRTVARLHISDGILHSTGKDERTSVEAHFKRLSQRLDKEFARPQSSKVTKVDFLSAK